MTESTKQTLTQAYANAERRRGAARSAGAPPRAEMRDPDRLAALIERFVSLDPADADGRIAMLTALHELGFPTARTRDAEADSPPHTLLLAFDGHEAPVAQLYVVPHAVLDAPLVNALEAVNGVTARHPLEYGVFQLASLFRVLSARAALDVETLEARVEALRNARAPDPDLESLPSKEQLQALHGVLRDHVVGSSVGGHAFDDPGALDVRIERAVAVADLLDWGAS